VLDDHLTLGGRPTVRHSRCTARRGSRSRS
jgi:hypothetical protein